MRTDVPFLSGAGLLVVLVTVLPACDRDARVGRHQAPPGGSRPEQVRQIPLVPGEPAPRRQVSNPFRGDVRAMAEGRRLYDWMNCSGCHFAGGGGIGPPLMDDDWIYGGDPDQIFDSIAAGRANGMPAYGDKLPSEQIWHIVTYVQSLSEDTEDRRREGSPEDPTRHER
jgi:cytochrome c oxidase cbb3-type subunit III